MPADEFNIFSGIKQPKLADLSTEELIESIVHTQRKLLRQESRQQLLRRVVQIRLYEEQERLMADAGIEPENPYGGLFKFLNGDS